MQTEGKKTSTAMGTTKNVFDIFRIFLCDVINDYTNFPK